MGEVKEPYEGGTGSLLEVVDMMCGVTEKLADIVRKQAVLIEQERIAGAVFPADLSEERKQAEDDLDRIEMKLRRYDMKEGICTAVGVVGSAIAAAFGGWDQALVTLVIFMVIDYLSGLIVAGIFRNSRKTENGALESRAGWKGLCRKGVTLLFVLIAYRLDLALGVNYIRNAVIIGFMANELISITENAGLMGIPLPTVIQNAIEVLTRKASVSKDGEQ